MKFTTRKYKKKIKHNNFVIVQYTMFGVTTGDLSQEILTRIISLLPHILPRSNKRTGMESHHAKQ